MTQSIGPTLAQREALNEIFDRRDIYTHESADGRVTMASANVLQSMNFKLRIELDCTGAQRSEWVSAEDDRYFCDGDLIVRRLGRAAPFHPQEPVNGWVRMDRNTFAKRGHMSGDTVIIEWMGMTLGIEPDGHTHS